MIYGYCRISTDKQNIDRQIRNIQKAYPKAKIKQEIYTGTKTDGRKVFEQLLKTVKAGDTIVFDAIDDDFVRARLTLLDKEGKEVKVAEEVFEGMLDRP